MKIYYGTTRKVFVFKNYAIKIAWSNVWTHFLRGLISNIDERTIYKIFNKSYPEIKIFAKSYIVLFGGLIQIMESCRQLEIEEFNFDYDNFVKFKSSNGIDFDFSTIENKSDSFGVNKKGKIVAIDYA